MEERWKDGWPRPQRSKDDVRQLSGFDQTFTQNDVNRDGRLTSDEFRKAWTTYSGYPK